MRDAFIATLVQLAVRDPRIVLLTGDLGFKVLDDFRARIPDQFYNVGVAEQNLAGVGAGLALTGHVVFTYSIGNFPTLRCLEQIRNDICYHKADVKIVAVGGGMAYGGLGPSHFAVEDLAILRAVPDMTVVAPGDAVEVEQLLPQIVARPGPVYLRLGRAGEARTHPDHAQIELGVPAVVRKGTDLLLLSTGGMLEVVSAAARQLEADGVSTQVVSVHTLRPMADDLIASMAGRFPALMTCEEHSIIGGLGGAVAEILLEAGVTPRFHRFGLPPTFPSGIGSHEYLRKVNRLDSTSLARAGRGLLAGRSPDELRSD